MKIGLYVGGFLFLLLAIFALYLFTTQSIPSNNHKNTNEQTTDTSSNQQEERIKEVAGKDLYKYENDFCKFSFEYPATAQILNKDTSPTLLKFTLENSSQINDQLNVQVWITDSKDKPSLNELRKQVVDRTAIFQRLMQSSSRNIQEITVSDLPAYLVTWTGTDKGKKVEGKQLLLVKDQCRYLFESGMYPAGSGNDSTFNSALTSLGWF